MEIWGEYLHKMMVIWTIGVAGIRCWTAIGTKYIM